MESIAKELKNVNNRCEALEQGANKRVIPLETDSDCNHIRLKKVVVKNNCERGASPPPNKRPRLRLEENPGVSRIDSASGSSLKEKAGPSKPLNEANIDSSDESTYDESSNIVCPTVGSDALNLEKQLLENISSEEEEKEGSDSDQSDDLDIPIKGLVKDGNWKPSDKTMSWFKKVADIDLSDEELNNLYERFLPSAELSSHFNPPKLPDMLWNKLKAGNQNTSELTKQRTIFRSQIILNRYCHDD